MEGLPDGTDRRRRRLDPEVEVRLVHRWVAFMFMVMFGLGMVIYRSAAAFSV